MRHRRYPVKKSVKIKASDPVAKGKGGRRRGNKLDNQEPALDDIDEQMMPRRLLEIQEAKQGMTEKRKKKNKGGRNKFLELTAKMGFRRRPWEDEEMLAKRVMRSKNSALDDEMIKVKAGTAGRDAKELDADFKLLDEKDERRKAAKKALREKRRKQAEAEAADQNDDDSEE